ncbi:MAG: hypothetical protein KIC98_08195 [Clostridioides difficile]|nr:hypothetical protein [Clostridioides sp.]MBS5787876.1 hypothetical protein [Clostridioides difficile]
MKKLTSEEFEQTFFEPMNEIEVVEPELLDDIDEYMFEMFINKDIKEIEYENTCIERLYENGDKSKIHILFPIKKNYYLVIVCDTKLKCIVGHNFTNINELYKL